MYVGCPLSYHKLRPHTRSGAGGIAQPSITAAASSILGLSSINSVDRPAALVAYIQIQKAWQGNPPSINQLSITKILFQPVFIAYYCVIQRVLHQRSSNDFEDKFQKGLTVLKWSVWVVLSGVVLLWTGLKSRATESPQALWGGIIIDSLGPILKNDEDNCDTNDLDKQSLPDDYQHSSSLKSKIRFPVSTREISQPSLKLSSSHILLHLDITRT